MSTRLIYFLALAAIALLLLTSLYLQFFQGFEPCPLCHLQRFCFALLGGIFLVGLLLPSRRMNHLLIACLSGIASVLGMVLAGRQVWLQHIAPVNSDECGVSIQYMMKILPWHEVIQKIFAGSAECSQRGWDFLTLDMAEWALVWFALMFSLAIYLGVKGFHHRHQ
ncbi:MAG: disulfide bond formation protein B [Gammaproteobacteria bacterium]|nr:MAG: disulfide bond formation protein B [Gammaproteobacteria bacterium]